MHSVLALGGRQPAPCICMASSASGCPSDAMIRAVAQTHKDTRTGRLKRSASCFMLFFRYGHDTFRRSIFMYIFRSTVWNPIHASAVFFVVLCFFPKLGGNEIKQAHNKEIENHGYQDSFNFQRSLDHKRNQSMQPAKQSCTQQDFRQLFLQIFHKLTFPPDFDAVTFASVCLSILLFDLFCNPLA